MLYRVSHKFRWSSASSEPMPPAADVFHDGTAPDWYDDEDTTFAALEELETDAC